METLSVDTAVEAAMDKLRAQMFERGAKGTHGIKRAFKIADFNGNGKLDREEFDEAMAFAGLFLTKAEGSALFSKFDKDGDANIDFTEFLRGLVGNLNERRSAMVERCFAILDRDGSGVLTVDDISGIYNTAKHPGVLSGECTEEEALKAFLEGFEGTSPTKDGRVTLAEFKDYYADLSASIPSDDYFVEMMEGVWMIQEKPLAAESATIRRYVGLMREKVRQKCRSTESEGKKLRDVFKFFDSDESGKITVDEFNGACERLGVPLNRKETRAFFAVYDTDGSGTITYEEFVKNVYGDDE